MTDLLIDIPENPVPENAKAGFFAARDGRKIRYARFAATGRPLKGTVILLHGRNECIEKYFETIRDLSGRGLGVATFDWRGQGGSDRLIRDPWRGYVDSFHDYVLDLETFFEEIVLPDCRGPYYVLAHSTGALVALLGAPLMLNRVRRIVLSAPLLGFAGDRPSLRSITRLANFLTTVGLGTRYMGGGAPNETRPFAFNKLTSDRARYARNQALLKAAPALGLGGATAAWVAAACTAIAAVRDPDAAAKVHIPLLIVAAGADEVVSNAAIEDYARRLRSGSLLTIDGARHELLQEADIYREQFLAAFDAFIPGTE